MQFIFNARIEVLGDMSKEEFASVSEKTILSAMKQLCADYKIQIDIVDLQLIDCTMTSEASANKNLLNVELAEDLTTLNCKRTSDHYKALFERHMADSTRYQALLFHSWKSLREQQKGLRRQAQKIKQLKQMIARLRIAAEGDGTVALEDVELKIPKALQKHLSKRESVACSAQLSVERANLEIFSL